MLLLLQEEEHSKAKLLLTLLNWTLIFKPLPNLSWLTPLDHWKDFLALLLLLQVISILKSNQYWRKRPLIPSIFSLNWQMLSNKPLLLPLLTIHQPMLLTSKLLSKQLWLNSKLLSLMFKLKLKLNSKEPNRLLNNSLKIPPVQSTKALHYSLKFNLKSHHRPLLLLMDLLKELMELLLDSKTIPLAL